MRGPRVERDTARSWSDPPIGVRVVMNVESLNREVEDSKYRHHRAHNVVGDGSSST